MVITGINILGVKLAGTAQTFVVIFLLVIGLMLVFGSFTGGSASNMEPFFTGGMNGYFAVLVVVPFLFVGFDVIPQSAKRSTFRPGRSASSSSSPSSSQRFGMS
ncbi:hypothetical protein SAMN04488693_1388 [Arthrobacter subterraneus]|uniref:Amino acid permease n=1 Tax=Arthrobacter subterraneus TaxID=335973 RepID=A0A1G8PW23_9MICC|nr:hypothetical protein SAMN04488693_1388 [Arthrobacter subterraneus]